MQASEIRNLTDDELRARLGELEREQFNLRFRRAGQPLEEPLRLRAVRRDIARLKTVQHERVRGVAPAAEPATTTRKTTRAKAGAKATAGKTR